MPETRRPLPPPLSLPKPGFGRRTPPALFPPLMGLFGLGLGWRAAGASFGWPSGIGDLILGAVTLIYAFGLVAWVAKPLRRPGVVLEELRVLPGRAGLAAASLCMMLLATALAPISEALARGLAMLAFCLHLGFAILLVHVLRAGPAEGRVLTPVFHLSFVGFIIGGLAANALGEHAIARAILWTMMLPASAIWAGSLWQLLRMRPPAPLRPLLAIHLAPASLFALVAYGAGMGNLALGFSILAIVILLALLASLRWLTEAGFSPLWGAFTFPLAACATALVTVSQGQGLAFIMGLGLLSFATVFIPIIAYRILKLWASGTLAMKTNAAEA